jgi:GNAT superfamily N-acetyltransferase
MLRNASGRSGGKSVESMACHHLLPGRLAVERGTFADYRALEHFHYAPGRPAAPVGVWRVVYRDLRLPICDLQLERRTSNVGGRPSNRKWQIEKRKSSPRTIAVGVLAYPTPASRARERALNLAGPRYGPKLAFVNAHVRTIARVIVHPQFRGLGVAAWLVRRICEECPVRYVEAFAAMGDVHPFFERGGMTRVPPAGEAEAAYFIFDREGRRDAK